MAATFNRVSDAFTRWLVRLARESDVAAIEKLIPLSVRGLQADYYSAAQMEAALGSVFGVDRQLIRDGTYYVVVVGGSSSSETVGDRRRRAPPSIAADPRLRSPRRPPARQAKVSSSDVAVGANAKHFSAATTKQVAMMPS